MPGRGAHARAGEHAAAAPPLEGDEAAQDDAAAGRGHRERDRRAAQDGPAAAADAGPAAVAARADGRQTRAGGVEVLQAHPRPLRAAPARRQEGADPDGAGLRGRVADVDRRPGATRGRAGGRGRHRRDRGGDDRGGDGGAGAPQRTVHVVDEAFAGSAPAVPGWPAWVDLAGRAQRRRRRARASGRGPRPAGRTRAPGAAGCTVKVCPVSAGARPIPAVTQRESAPRTVSQARPRRYCRRRRIWSAAFGAAGARHPAAHADAVGVPGRVADVDRRPRLRPGAQEVARARRRGRDRERRQEGDDGDDGAQDPSHVRKIPRTRRKFRCGPRDSVIAEWAAKDA